MNNILTSAEKKMISNLNDKMKISTNVEKKMEPNFNNKLKILKKC